MNCVNGAADRLRRGSANPPRTMVIMEAPSNEKNRPFIDCRGVCSGHGSCMANLLAAPFVLTWRATEIYCIPAMDVLLNRCLSWSLRKACYCCLDCPCFTFTDKSFPANATSLGKVKDAGSLEWLRASEVVGNPRVEGQRPVLIRNGITASDIGQGALGDCWLLSAFACLSEFPGAIRNLFCTNEINARGKYRVRLYDDMKADWCEVTVDDLVPCKGGRPAFAQPNEGELWVLILEKAFAKHCNSYAGIDGGLTLWALHAMTGDHVFRLTRDDNSTTWERLNLKNHGTAAEPRKCGLYHCSPKEIHSPEKLWKLLKEYDRCNACLAASISGAGGEAKRSDGLVAGHAYSILQAREVGGFQLVQVRNPWGSFEWKGDWSDQSPMWSKHPSVQRELWPEMATTPRDRMNDGLFWMPFEIFAALFTDIDVCDRSTGLNDLALRHDEDSGWAGPLRACGYGCLKYWLCCHGCAALYCGHQTTADTKPLPERCCACFDGSPGCVP